mgnify:CR=1 FL=1
MKKHQYTYIPSKTITRSYKAIAKNSTLKITLELFSNDMLDVQRKIEALARVTSLGDTWEIYLEDNSL